MKKVYLLLILGILAAGLVGCGMGSGGSGLRQESYRLPGTQGFSTPQAEVTIVAEKVPYPDGGRLSVSSQPKGAKISLNGSDTSQVTPQVFESVETGKTSVSLQIPGYREWRGTVTIEKGKTTKVSVKLRKLTPGALKVIVSWQGRRGPGVVVKLDPSSETKTTNRDGICIFKQLDPGTYSVTAGKIISGESYAGVVVKIRVSSAKTVTTKISLDPGPVFFITSVEIEELVVDGTAHPATAQMAIKANALAQAKIRLKGIGSGKCSGYLELDGKRWEPFSVQVTDGMAQLVTPNLPTDQETTQHTLQAKVLRPTTVESPALTYSIIE